MNEPARSTCAQVRSPTGEIDLDAAYAMCRRITAEHGRTYYLATTLLSPPRRRAVHALYAFARMVDDIVDHAEDPTHVLDPRDSGTRHHADTAPASRQGGRTNQASTPLDGGVSPLLVSPSPGVQPNAVGPGAVEAQRLDVVERRLDAALGTTQSVAADTGAAVARRLDAVEQQLREALDHRGAQPCLGSDATLQLDAVELEYGDPRTRQIIAAAADTITRYEIDHRHFWTFLDAMRMDVPGTGLYRTRYATMAELREYMRGSAAAIGLQLLPVLGTVVPVTEAEPAAAALGEAFQLTNFLRDVAEDLDRGRIYLPTEELAAFGVDEAHLRAARHTGHTDAPLRRALAHLIAINRDIYRRATPGIDLLDPRVRPAIGTARILYAEILDRIEAADYQVFDTRARVPRHRRLLVATSGFVTATWRR
ncbi:phytoene/squalene synthase family protein [Nocardia sp. NPDC058176]|uniref:phytoene/squalene synthase family protein n=1 Tax=Nocardia sp. NPDC058176 TaxID=3346368 RepID=UPI0036DA07E5